ncbi:MAG: GNAT family N-acetyltransferase [Pseudomonadota bacterium]
MLTDPEATMPPDGQCPSDAALTQRLEQANLNAWPSAINHWDGAWCLRIMPGSRSRRVNSVTVFDPADDADLEARVDRMLEHFERHRVRPVFRWTPLFPESLAASLMRRGWNRISETLVMVRRPEAAPNRSNPNSMTAFATSAVDRSSWLDGVVATGAAEAGNRKVLERTLSMIGSSFTTWLAVDANGAPVATTLAVSDGSFVGLFLVHVAPEQRRKGLAQTLVARACAFERSHGAPTAWLQVEADNGPGTALYKKAGFRTAYRYAYWVHDEGTGIS